MSNETPESNHAADAEPGSADLQEPSTEKAPDAEPKSAEAEAPEGAEPSHQAVGIGVIGAPLVDPEQVEAPSPE